MTPKRQFILVATFILLIGFLSVAFIYLYTQPTQPEEQVVFETFEELDETYIYIDEEGNATCQLIVQLPPSKLTDYMKYAIQSIGTDVYGQVFSEFVNSNWAKFGLETENIAYTITGFSAGENLKITVLWGIPNIAQRVDNRWTISLDWVDNQSVAQETIATLDSAWTLTRNISTTGRFVNYLKMIIVLPEGAENISNPYIGNSYADDYGGGSYGEASFYAEQIDGRTAFVENSVMVFSVQKEMTLTVEQLLENMLFQTIGYDGAFPTDNWTFISSVGRIRLDLKYGRELDDQYSIFIGQSEYSLSPAQLLYYTADAIVTIDQGDQFSIQQPVSVIAPSTENGDFGTFWESLSKTEYVSLAQQIRDNIAFTGEALGVIATPRGQIRFKDALLTFTRILSTYEESGALPNTIILAPSPADQLSWGDTSVPANYAYFLLSDSFIITGTGAVNEVLDNVYQPEYDNRAYANGLFDWAHANIKYELIPSPPTSEWVLENKRGQCREYTNVYLALLRTAGIPAKRISGWIVITGVWNPPAGLEPFMKGTTLDGRTIGSHAWVQVYLPGEGWTFADATWGYFESIPYSIYQQQEETWISALAGYEAAYGGL